MQQTERVQEVKFDPNEEKFIKEAGRDWKKHLRDDIAWETWWKIGWALLLGRRSIMRQLKLNEPRGSSYNIAFSRYLNQYFPGLAVTKQASYILYLRDDPEREAICKQLRQEMTPQQKTRIVDPNSMARRVRAVLREREGKPPLRKPKPMAERIRELEAENAHLHEQLGDHDPAAVVVSWFDSNSIHGIARTLLAKNAEKALELANELLRRVRDDV